jgi:hypothetical protein
LPKKISLPLLYIKIPLILLLLSLVLPQMTVHSASPGFIHGVVRDTDNNLLPNIQVVIINSNTHDVESSQITDSSGGYTSTSLEDGTFEVKFVDSNGIYADATSTPISIFSGSNVEFNKFLPLSLSVQTFSDTNNNAGLIAGDLQWSNLSSSNVSYNVYFLTNSNQVVGSPITVPGTTYSLANVPPTAKRLGVQVISPNAALGPIISTPLWDSGAYIPQYYTLYDTDPAPGSFDLRLTWPKPLDESQFDRYVITYRDINYQAIGSDEEIVTPASSYVHTPTPAITSSVYSVEIKLKTNKNEIAPRSFTMLVSDLTTNKAAQTPSSNLSLIAPTSFIFFNDTDPAIHSIGGALEWTEDPNPGAITNYEMYLLDGNGIKLSSALTLNKHPGYIGNYRVYLPNGTSLTVNGVTASKLGVYPKDANGAEGHPIIIDITDRVDSLPRSMSFHDGDMTTNHVKNTLRWYSAGDESAITGYQVYFADEWGNLILPALSTQTKASAPQFYTFSIDHPIPMTSANIPASKIAIVSLTGNALDNKVSIPLWDLPRHIITNAHFMDSNPAVGGITANLYWDRLPDETFVSKYLIYYFDNVDNKVVIASEDKKPGSGSYSHTLTPEEYGQIPSYARYLIIAVQDTYGNLIPLPTDYNELEDNTLSKPTNQLSPPVDSTLSVVNSVYYAYNTQKSANLISWKHPDDSSNINSFELYFLNSQGQKLESIATIRKSHFGENNVFVPSNIVFPATASKIGIFSKNANGEESKLYAAIPLFNLVRAAIDPNSEGVGVDKVINFIKGDGRFRKEDIQALLGLIDPISQTN